MIKNVIFDCSDTLLHFESVDYLTELLSGDRERAERIHKTLFLSEEWRDYDRGVYSDSEVSGILLPLLPPEDRRIGALYLENWFLKYSITEGIPELLDELKAKGYRIFVLSDYPARFETVWNSFDIFKKFDGRIASYEVGSKKYELKPFEMLLKKYSLQKVECLFTYDSLGCIEAAEKVGIRTHLFTGVPGLRKALNL